MITWGHIYQLEALPCGISICWTEELKSCLNSQFLQHCPFHFNFLFMVIKMGFEPERARIFRIFPKALLLTFSIIQLVCCGLALITEVIHIFLPVVQLQFYTLKRLSIVCGEGKKFNGCHLHQILITLIYIQSSISQIIEFLL